jgi:hypothetical protein
MPLKREKSVTRGPREAINALEEKKVGLKGIERAHQCPLEEKSRFQGHREWLSMPFKEKRTVARESILPIPKNEKKTVARGIENGCQRP